MKGAFLVHFIGNNVYMNALVERDLVYTTDLELSEAFLRKNLKEVKEDMQFQPRIRTITAQEIDTIQIGSILIYGYNTIKITKPNDSEFSQDDISQLLKTCIFLMLAKEEDNVCLVRLLHLNYVTIAQDEITIVVPQYFRKSEMVYYSIDYIYDCNYEITLQSNYEYDEIDDGYHPCPIDMFGLKNGIELTLDHSMYKIFIYEISDAINTHLRLNIKVDYADENIVIKYDELNISESYMVICYECGLERFLPEENYDNIYIQILGLPSKGAHVYIECFDGNGNDVAVNNDEN